MDFEAVLGINHLLPLSTQKERTLLKTFLLCYLRKFFQELFQKRISNDSTLFNHTTMECYTMDIKTTQLLIRDIIETHEYTLEGIAYHTHIPFDVILDAACGNNRSLSVTAWAKIVELYAEVKPDVVQELLHKITIRP